MDGKKSYPKLSSRVNKKPIIVRVNYPKDFLVGYLESMLLVGMITRRVREETLVAWSIIFSYVSLPWTWLAQLKIYCLDQFEGLQQ